MNPIQSLAFRRRIARAAALLVILSLGVWTLAPMKSTSKHAPLDMHVEPPASSDAETVVWSAAALSTSIWSTPPPPPTPLQEPEPPAPRVRRPELQLLGIVTEVDGRRRAAFFDPAENAVVQVAEGDELGGFAIEHVELRRVRLVLGSTRCEFELDAERGG